MVGHLTSSHEAIEDWASHESVAGFTPDATIDRDETIYVVCESFTRYPQVVKIEQGSMRLLTDLRHPGANAYLACGMRLEEVQWEAPDGLIIQGLLVLPAGKGPFPLVLNVHGGPVWAWRNRWGVANGDRHPYVGLLAEEGFASLYVNPRGSHGRGQEFAGAVRGDMAGRDVEDLLSGIRHLAGRGLIDTDRLAVTGNSYGGQMAAWLAATSTMFAAAIPTSPVTDFVSQHYTSDIPEFDTLFLQERPHDSDASHRRLSPLAYVANASTPTLLTAGLGDRTTPAGQATMFWHALQEVGVPTSLILYPQQGHGISGFPDTTDFLSRMLTWLRRYVR